ncbi:unnamed protein product [Musa acuminata subsp. burmannicoides]
MTNSISSFRRYLTVWTHDYYYILSMTCSTNLLFTFAFSVCR